MRDNNVRSPLARNAGMKEKYLIFGISFRKGVIFPLTLVLAGLAASCTSKNSNNNVAATVDGQKIYSADVEKYFQNQIAGSPQPPSDEQATSLRLSILRQLIENEILMHRAAKLGLLATDEEVDRKLNEIKAPYTAEQFDKELKDRKSSLDDYKHDIRRALTAEKVLHKEITSKINVSSQDIAAYYKQNSAEFNRIEPRYHLAHILVTTSADPQGRDAGNKARNEAEARQKILAALARLRAGEDFGSVAMTFSEDSATAANGGDIGIAPESALKQTDALTRESVLKLKPGQNTDIIPLGNPATRQIAGFQIVKLLELEPAGQREISDPRVEQEIRGKLQDHREQLLKAAYYEVMHDQAKIENFYAQHVLDSTGSSQ
jgi:peptidyl-prolyl cis-trans isomerase SurA